MRHIFIFLIGLVITQPSFAVDQVPFGNQINSVKNYNRATSQIATSGAIGKGGIGELAESGFKTIIDLRTKKEGAKEEGALVEAAGMNYINIPVTSAGISSEQLLAFSKAIEETEAPTLIHCASGNRVGAMWTVYRLSKGIDAKTAFEEGRTAGMRQNLEDKVKEQCEVC